MKSERIASGVGEAKNGWKRPYMTFRMPAFRSGWVGAWDAIKAAWTKDNRIQVTEDIEFSVYVKEDSLAQIEVKWT